MDGRNSLALRLSYDLAGVTDRGAYLNAMVQSLGMIFPSESNGWVGARLSTQTFEVLGTNGTDSPKFVETLVRSADRHPMFTSYMSPPGDISPRRISDIIGDRDWHNHPVYSELFIPWGGATREMTLVVAPVSPADWHGWGFQRSRTDFTENEIDLATSLQPLLVAFHRLSRLTTDRTPTDHRHLTDRETQILQLVAQGFSAVDIALILRISPLTVRKHLEHVYEKLDEHDRLRAVSVAIQAGIIQR